MICFGFVLISNIMLVSKREYYYTTIKDEQGVQYSHTVKTV